MGVDNDVAVDDNGVNEEVNEYTASDNDVDNGRSAVRFETTTVVADESNRRGMPRRALRPNGERCYKHIQERGKLKRSTIDYVRGV